MKIIKLTETQLSNMIKNSLNKGLKNPTSFKNLNENIIMEENDYDTEYIISILKKAPRYLKSLLNKLDDIPCKNSKGESRRCTKIPAVLHDYMWDR